MENFIRRYAEIITINKTTKINFYDIYEMPPKVTVEISTTSSRLIYGNDSQMLVPVVNKISAILETTTNTSSPSPDGGGANLCYADSVEDCRAYCGSHYAEKGYSSPVDCGDYCDDNCT